MTIAITGKRLGPLGQGQESITPYRWQVDGTVNGGITDKPTVVQWVSGGVLAYVPGPRQVRVGVVTAAKGAQWLQTYADNVWTNNNLALSEV
jgi:hypothetical protein